MNNKKTILAGLLIAVFGTGFALAEELSGQGNLAELSEEQVAPISEAVVEVSSSVEESVKTPVEPVDVDAVIEESREHYVAGDFEGAEAGFQAVLASEPNNKKAAFYLRELAARHRKAEESAMDDVRDEWGLILRYYPVGDRFLKSMKLEEVTQATDITDQISAVEFPKGASVIYMPELKKLFAKNTLVNLLELEDLLAVFDQVEAGALGRQVKIETRFVEFAEGALEELGFEWSIPNDIDLGGDVTLPGGQNLFADSLRSVPYTQTQRLGMGELSSGGDWGQVPVDGLWNANRISDTFGSEAGSMNLTFNFNDQIDLLIRAMDQTSGIDVLSAPSIVTLSGEKATIRVGERHNYPTVYEEGASSGTMLHVRYMDFEEKILGVEMDVTPQIKGSEIELTVNPKITDLVGWQQFMLSPADTSYTWYQFRVGMQYEHDAIVAKLPVFKRREIKTEVSVTTGSTVGMGGLITEKLEAFDDRVPVLGSLPFIGRLFRSEGERTVKRNLTIFVTATIVEPNGHVVTGTPYE